jgi:O-antigen biosynthesis protein
MKISIIVPIFNGIRYLPSFLDSLEAAAPEGSRVYLVDDASTEPVDTAVPSTALFMNAVRLRNDVNLGYSGSVNRAFSICDGDYIFQLNTDLILDPNCLTAMIEFLSTNKKAGIVGSKLVYPTNGRVQHVGMTFGQLSKRHVFEGMAASHPLCCRDRDCQIVTGATAGMTRQAFNALGPLDEAYFNSNLDLDHCLRSIKLGFRNSVVAASMAYHWVSQSGPARFAGFNEAQALLWRQWGAMIKTDLPRFLDEAIEFLLGTRPELAGVEFEILNLSTSIDEALIVDALDRAWPGVRARVAHHRTRNLAASQLWLPMILPHWKRATPQPFIYIVDSAQMLSQNSLWFERRRRIVTEEIVIDLSAAIYTTNEFVEEWGGRQ